MRRVAVIGGGLSGLASAFYLQEEAARRGLSIAVSLWESGPHFGGKIRTVEREDYRCETGPNGFLDNTPETLELVDRLGLTPRLLRSSDAARRRFIFCAGRLRQLPEKPLSFFRSDLLSLRGRLRIIGEYFVGGKRDADPAEDESVASFIRRRLGEEALQKLIDPMTSGIYAGDPEKMSMASCFPRIVALEKNYGGLIRGMIAKQKEARAGGRKGPQGAGPGGTLTSFRDGLGELIAALAERLGEGGHTGAAVSSLSFSGGREHTRYTLLFEDGRRAEAEAVVVATPAYAAAGMLAGLSPPAADKLLSIPYSAISVVHFGYERKSLGLTLDGFGFLIPHLEKRRILGSLWSSSIFSNRAPAGNALVTNMVGGARDSRTPLLDDTALAEIVREELRVTMRQEPPPSFSLITRWEKGIPQYLQGHENLLQEIEGILQEHTGLFLVGNAYRGIGVNDCVKAASALAPRVVDHLGKMS